MHFGCNIEGYVTYNSGAINPPFRSVPWQGVSRYLYPSVSDNNKWNMLFTLSFDLFAATELYFADKGFALIHSSRRLGSTLDSR